VCEIQRFTFRVPQQHLVTKRRKAVVDVAHLSRRVRLAVAGDAAVRAQHVAAIPPIVVAVYRKDGRICAVEESTRDRLIIAVQVRVAVQHEERGSNQRQRASQGAAGAKRTGAIVRITDAQAPARSVADRRLDLCAQMTDAQDDVADATAAEQLELMDEKGSARHVHERFRDVTCERAKPCCRAAGQDRDRQHYETSTFVPSKSNRNRSS
jgi:hypothetical protein